MLLGGPPEAHCPKVVVVQTPERLQQAPVTQALAVQVDLKPCQVLPSPHADTSGPVTVHENVVLLQHAPVQGFGVQVVPAPRKRLVLVVPHPCARTSVQSPTLEQQAP
jgi:hypothetical protein